MKKEELTKLVDGPVEEVESEIRAALGREGFGVLTRIDVADVMRTKLGIERPPMCILGACNPRLAHAALELDKSAALVLPCNVVLEAEGDATRVSIADPRVLMPSPAFSDLADEAAGRLSSALASLGASRSAPPAEPSPAGAVAVAASAEPPQADSPNTAPSSIEAERSYRDGFASHRRPVWAVATLSPVYAKADDSLRRVAERLAEEGIGLALIKTGGESTGAVSERDIVRALATGADPDRTLASDVMSETVHGVEATDSLADVTTNLVELGVRHAPVLEAGEVIGVVSLRDLASALVDAQRRQ